MRESRALAVRARALVLIAGLTLVFSCSLAAVLPPLAPAAFAQGSADITVGVSEDKDGSFKVVGLFPVEAGRKAAWGVLTDYNRMGEFLPSIRYSQVKSRRPDCVLLTQEVSGQFLVFSKTLRVLLEVQEEPVSRIAFKDVSGEDFYFYAGTWQLIEEANGTEIRYRSKVKPKVPLPVIGRDLFLDSMRSMLRAVRAEILRREKARPDKPSPDKSERPAPDRPEKPDQAPPAVSSTNRNAIR